MLLYFFKKIPKKIQESWLRTRKLLFFFNATVLEDAFPCCKIIDRGHSKIFKNISKGLKLKILNSNLDFKF